MAFGQEINNHSKFFEIYLFLIMSNVSLFQYVRKEVSTEFDCVKNTIAYSQNLKCPSY